MSLVSRKHNPLGHTIISVLLILADFISTLLSYLSSYKVCVDSYITSFLSNN